MTEFYSHIVNVSMTQQENFKAKFRRNKSFVLFLFSMPGKGSSELFFISAMSSDYFTTHFNTLLLIHAAIHG